MTELQLQAIVEQQGIESTGKSDLDMMTVNGRKVSKWSLDAARMGDDVMTTKGFYKMVRSFLDQYVGEEKVFPTKNGAPRILTEFIDKPYKFELRDEYVIGPRPKPLPSVKACYYHGKPATQKVLEHFCRSTPVVSQCDNPRCLSRLVIVPKRDPGAPKSAAPTSYRVTMNALINSCLKPTPSTLPLATNEIKKLHHYKYYLTVDAANAFWSIPLDEESRRMTAFQTHEGIFAWDRLTMGTRPASTVQQSAYYRAMDKYLPKEYRHRFASYADDIAAGANTLEELFELLKAIIICFDKAGIQVKASKLVFGVKEISFHNYTISEEQTRPKDENLCPIRNCSIPKNVTEIKAFLGCTQQMSQYCQYYGIVAHPLHRLTRDSVPFPKPWLPGTDYDVAFHRIKSMMLDTALFLWNKDSSKRLFIEVDACNEGWGACAYQYDTPKPPDVEDEGRHMLLSKKPKRVVEWISKAWTDYEKELPVFYREALARLLCLEHFRNLIETQQVHAGTTVYTDHAPSTYTGSLSNKGRLSTWRIHETSDLIATVQTLYKAGQYLGPPHGGLADPLSRLPREDSFQRLQLPAVLHELLHRLPDSVKNARSIRVTAEKDTHLATRLVQRWRNPKNPISNTRSDVKEDSDFLITAPFADKCTHKVAQLIRDGKKFAALLPVSLLSEIDITKEKKVDEYVRQQRKLMPTIVITALNLAWLISHPDYTLDKPGHSVLCSSVDVPFDGTTSVEGSMFLSSPFNGPERQRAASTTQWEHAVVSAIDDLFRDGAVRLPEKSTDISAVSLVLTRSQAAKSVSAEKPKRKSCVRGKAASDTLTFRGTPPPDPHTAWIGKQDPTEIPRDGRLLVDPNGFPKGLLVCEDPTHRKRIIVPREQRDRLIKHEHLSLLHVGHDRVRRTLSQRYYWHKMDELIKSTVTSCPDCQRAQTRRQQLNAEFAQADAEQLALPRQRYGIDFYGHAKGEILVAMDLVTREVILWFLKNRKQETVARALLNGLVFIKGVPLEFRSDNAPEFIKGVVAAMNHYLGVEQITTGGHNPRGNANVERFMHTLGHMLRVASKDEYNNIQDYVPCMAFAHNCTYSSVIGCSPFEAGHGLKARTVAEARMALPRLQLMEDEAADTTASRNWDKSLPKKVLELASRMASVAQMHSEWHRRSTAQRLNHAGRPIDERLLERGAKVYFYRPPSQREIATSGRKAKHLAHFHGPATVVGRVRERQAQLSFEGRTFDRDIALIIPAKQFGELDSVDYDPIVNSVDQSPVLHKKGQLPKEGELIITKDENGSGWYLSEVLRVLPDFLEVRYFTTPTPPLDQYEQSSIASRVDRLRNMCFRRTWHVRFGKHVGRATCHPPYPNNEDLQVWKGTINRDHLDDMVLVRNVRVDSEGRLSEDSLRVAAELPVPHEKLDTIEDEAEKHSLRPSLFLHSRERLCDCTHCSGLIAKSRN